MHPSRKTFQFDIHVPHLACLKARSLEHQCFLQELRPRPHHLPELVKIARSDSLRIWGSTVLPTGIQWCEDHWYLPRQSPRDMQLGDRSLLSIWVPIQTIRMAIRVFGRCFYWVRGPQHGNYWETLHGTQSEALGWSWLCGHDRAGWNARCYRRTYILGLTYTIQV